jgi:DNA-binding CsgD family transcriptional regulator
MVRLAMDRQDFMRRVRAFEMYSITTDLRRLQVPTLVLGTRVPDPRTEREAQYIAATVPDARLQILEGDGRAADGAAHVVAAIEGFLESLSAPDARQGTRLSGRELEVLRLVAAGKSNQDIAEDLVISPNTVARHLSNVFDKIGAANRAEAVAYAARHSLL